MSFFSPFYSGTSACPPWWSSGHMSSWRMTWNTFQISPRYCSSVFIWPTIQILRKEKTNIWPSISICHVRWRWGSLCLPRTWPPAWPSRLSEWVWCLSSICQSSLDVQNPNAKGFIFSFIWPTGWGEHPPFEIKIPGKFLTAQIFTKQSECMYLVPFWWWRVTQYTPFQFVLF